MDRVDVYRDVLETLRLYSRQYPSNLDEDQLQGIATFVSDWTYRQIEEAKVADWSLTTPMRKFDPGSIYIWRALQGLREYTAQSNQEVRQLLQGLEHSLGLASNGANSAEIIVFLEELVVMVNEIKKSMVTRDDVLALTAAISELQEPSIQIAAIPQTVPVNTTATTGPFPRLFPESGDVPAALPTESQASTQNPVSRPVTKPFIRRWQKVALLVGLVLVAVNGPALAATIDPEKGIGGAVKDFADRKQIGVLDWQLEHFADWKHSLELKIGGEAGGDKAPEKTPTGTVPDPSATTLDQQRQQLIKAVRATWLVAKKKDFGPERTRFWNDLQEVMVKYNLSRDEVFVYPPGVRDKLSLSLAQKVLTNPSGGFIISAQDDQAQTYKVMFYCLEGKCVEAY